MAWRGCSWRSPPPRSPRLCTGTGSNGAAAMTSALKPRPMLLCRSAQRDPFHLHIVVFGAEMMPTFNPVCFDAFARLLARPDPTDVPRRGHVSRFEGDPDRRATRLPGILMAWLQRR